MASRVTILLLGVCLVGALTVWASAQPAERPAPGAAADNPLAVSLIQLIANPDTFDGKYVRVWGYVRIEHEGSSIYLHRDDCDQMLTKNGLWLAVSDVAAEGSKEAAVNNKYALAEGRFDARKHGHRGLWSGSLEQVSRLEPWQIRKANK
jgi:hypothetical protein